MKQIKYKKLKNGCIICTSHHEVRRNGKRQRIARYIYEKNYGIIKNKKLEVNHTCKNINCININHLILGKNSRKQINGKKLKNGCIICISHTTSSGYPKIFQNNKSWQMSRFIYTQKYGKIKKGFHVMHKCDNPSCININHLKLGTNRDNIIDAKNKGRLSYGENRPNSKLNDKKVEEILKIDFSKTSNVKVGKIYDVSYATIDGIRNNKTWKHIKRMRR